jgi:hypothetical protein
LIPTNKYDLERTAQYCHFALNITSARQFARYLGERMRFPVAHAQTGALRMARIRTGGELEAALKAVAWPLLMAIFMFIWTYCEANGLDELTSTVIAYPLTLILCLVLERTIPHESSWNDWRADYAIDHMPVFTDIFHTCMTAVAVHGSKHACAVFFTRFGLGFRLFDTLPLLLQFTMAVLVAEVGQYWQHRLSHTCSWLWPFHAVHHAVPRLYGLNTGRFHFVNQALATFMGYPPLVRRIST